MAALAVPMTYAPTRLGDLDGEVTDPARGRVDQHPLAGPQAGGVDKGLPGGERGQRQRARLDVGRGRRGLRAKARAGPVTYSAWAPWPYG